MQVRGKVTAKDERAGRDENDAGSNESAVNKTAREKPRNSRRNSGRGHGRGRRENGNTNSSATDDTTAAVTRLRTRMKIRLMTAVTLLDEEDVSVAEMTAITATADIGTAVTPLSTDGTIVYFAYRTRERTTPRLTGTRRKKLDEGLHCCYFMQ